MRNHKFHLLSQISNSFYYLTCWRTLFNWLQSNSMTKFRMWVPLWLRKLLVFTRLPQNWTTHIYIDVENVGLIDSHMANANRFRMVYGHNREPSQIRIRFSKCEVNANCARYGWTTASWGLSSIQLTVSLFLWVFLFHFCFNCFVISFDSNS